MSSYYTFCAIVLSILCIKLLQALQLLLQKYTYTYLRTFFLLCLMQEYPSHQALKSNCSLGRNVNEQFGHGRLGVT